MQGSEFGTRYAVITQSPFFFSLSHLYLRTPPSYPTAIPKLTARLASQSYRQSCPAIFFTSSCLGPGDSTAGSLSFVHLAVLSSTCVRPELFSYLRNFSSPGPWFFNLDPAAVACLTAHACAPFCCRCFSSVCVCARDRVCA